MAKKDMIKKLTSIKGIGDAKAESIIDSGFDSVEKISKAKTSDLTKIDGINDELADLIIKEIKTSDKKTQVKPKEVKEKEKTAAGKKDNTEKKQEKQLKKPKKEPVKTEKKKEKTKEEPKEEKKSFTPKKKAKLTDEIKVNLEKRKDIKKRTPNFLREEWYRYKRIPKNWRRPDGLHSKMRINLKYRPSRVRVGYRGPKKVRGLHPSGFEEVMVYNVKDLEKINPDTQAARIGGTVGTRKRTEIEKKAEELDIRLLNI